MSRLLSDASKATTNSDSDAAANESDAQENLFLKRCQTHILLLCLKASGSVLARALHPSAGDLHQVALDSAVAAEALRVEYGPEPGRIPSHHFLSSVATD